MEYIVYWVGCGGNQIELEKFDSREEAEDYIWEMYEEEADELDEEEYYAITERKI